MDVCIENIIRELKLHGVAKEKIDEVYASYQLACHIHMNQYRQSGEPYITHPLNVANNVLKMEVYDPDTISAALLHDVIEDAEFNFRKEDLAQIINPTVAELVDGVTKMSKMNFSNKEEEIAANTRKIINGLTKDIRIGIIKIADRKHNMSTIEWKSEKKQKENAAETLEIFVPIAIKIGAYQSKNELEELSLKYLYPDIYKEIYERRQIITEQQRPQLEEMAYKIKNELKIKGINNDIVFRNRSIYTLFNDITDGYKIENIFDLSYFKILLETEDDCYITLGIIHRQNTPVNERFKDYFRNPRGFYQSLHTTVLDNNGSFKKVKIRTYDMDKRDAYGLIADLNKNRSIDDIQTEFREKWFDMKLQKIDDTFKDNREFVKTVKRDLLGEEIYVYGIKGGITIPKGSTALDFVCEILSTEELKNLTSIIVNGKEVKFDKKLKNNDRVQVVCDGKINNIDLYESVTTEKAKMMIKGIKGNTD